MHKGEEFKSQPTKLTGLAKNLNKQESFNKTCKTMIIVTTGKYATQYTATILVLYVSNILAIYLMYLLYISSIFILYLSYFI